jgi:hypothetical protein
MRKLAYKMINSTTVLLPAWKKILEELKMKERLMPRDVKTWWNSTFTMLDFALEYQKAIDLMTGGRGNGLRALEMREEEWAIAGQLRKVLKASATRCPYQLCKHYHTGFQ